MNKFVTSLSLAALVAVTFSACGGAKPAPAQEEADFRCRIDNQLQPEWVCGNELIVEGAMTAVGSAPMSKLGMSFTKNEAVNTARSELARQIQVQVKTKIEQFARSTGIGDNETAEKVSTQVSKSVAKTTMVGSKMMKSRQVGNSLYVLVGVPEKTVNAAAKKEVKTSMKNDEALWQQFQSKKALDSLEAEFPSD